MGKKLKLYISSTFEDLEDFRKSAIDFCLKTGKNDFEFCDIMEFMDDNGKSERSIDICLNEVRKCDVIIFILGNRLGSIADEIHKKTFIQLEYEAAIESGKDIYRFVMDQDDIILGEEKDAYLKFISILKPYAFHSFSDLYTFKLEMLCVFYKIKPSPSYMADEYVLKSKIDRENQVTIVKTKTKFANKNVIAFCYISNENDFSHYLNCRISNIELNSVQLKYGLQFYISLNMCSPGIDDQEAVMAFTDEIASNLLNKKDCIFSINDLYSHLNTKTDIKYLIIPLRISDSLEGNEEMINQICKLLMNFSKQEFIPALGDKRVVFLINLELNKRNDNDPIIINAINKMETSLKMIRLNKLGLIEDNLILEWIKTNFSSSQMQAQEFLNVYFPSDEGTSMEIRVKQADKFIQSYSKNKINELHQTQ